MHASRSRRAERDVAAAVAAGWSTPMHHGSVAASSFANHTATDAVAAVGAAVTVAPELLKTSTVLHMYSCYPLLDCCHC